MISSLAGFMAKQHAKILIIDTDPQQSCVDWASEEEHTNIDVMSHLDEDTFFDVIKAVATDYDTILVDTAGYDSRMATYAVQASDLILIPCRGSKKDVMGAARTWKHATTLTEKYKHQPRVRIVLWNVNQSTSVYRHAKAALKEAELPILPQAVPTLTGFDVMSWNGGLPNGKAISALGSFVAALQIEKLLDYYTRDKEVA
tara:strand:- start:3380 stop:3982 length:603 start_codon:yes stop_codon:yes gene_type:complete